MQTWSLEVEVEMSSYKMENKMSLGTQIKISRSTDISAYRVFYKQDPIFAKLSHSEILVNYKNNKIKQKKTQNGYV